ncbi:uncharacterized protein LOC143224240 [Tachypleus tridentatus]|uniref:uncharacterized protein LOC143224240 n=1 Tax=Tachypleus tridentatus TaxID=6853 RepID=UPI003FD5FE27
MQKTLFCLAVIVVLFSVVASQGFYPSVFGGQPNFGGGFTGGFPYGLGFQQQFPGYGRGFPGALGGIGAASNSFGLYAGQAGSLGLNPIFGQGFAGVGSFPGGLNTAFSGGLPGSYSGLRRSGDHQQ